MKQTKGMREDGPYRFLAYGLAAAVFLSTLGVGVFVFAIPLLALHESISGLMLGATFSGYFTAKLIISPFAGRLADKTGPRPLLTASALAGVLIPLAALSSDRNEVLYLVQFFLGLSAGTMKPVAAAAIAAIVPGRSQGRVFGLYNAFYTSAFFFAPILGGLLFFDRDLLPVILFLCACMAASLLIVQALVPKNLSCSSQPGQGSEHEPVNRARAWSLLPAVCGRTACTACLIAFYPALLAENLHGPAWLTGLLFAASSITACLFMPLGGRLADRFDRKALVVAGMAVSSLCLALLGTMETAPGFLTAGIVLGLGSSVSFPASMALATSMGDAKGRIMGWFHAAANAGFVIGPLLCGLLVEWSGGIPVSMGLMGSLGLVCVLPLALSGFWDKKHFSWRSTASFAVAVVVLAVAVLAVRGAYDRDAGLASPGPGTPLSYAGVAMANVVRMNLSGVDEDTGANASGAAFATIAELEADFGYRNPDGSIGRVNMAAGKKPVRVSEPAFELIDRALDISRDSSGVFDITIGAVTALPYYYQEKAQKDKASLVDYRKVVLDRAGQTVFLPKEGMALDLGGLAKGTIMDAAAETLKRHGVPSALVEAGGDMYCYGDREWRIGIQDPRGDGLLGVISVANAGVCGSGDYYQYAITGENSTAKRKHHILNPALLDSADKSIAVTVVAPSAELADALATTLFILGPKDGLKLLAGHYENCSALWVLPDRSMVTSGKFPFQAADKAPSAALSEL